jgi:thiol-disulfide isomerase/thioredoxin
MNKLNIVFVITLSVFLSACGASNNDPLANAKGKWTYINYWATWCKPCIEEIPELNEFAAQNPYLVVLGVNFDGIQGDELKAAEAKLGIEFTNLAQDPHQQFGYERPNVLPVTIVINPEGNVIHQLVGPQTFGSLMAAFN